MRVLNDFNKGYKLLFFLFFEFSQVRGLTWAQSKSDSYRRLNPTKINWGCTPASGKFPEQFLNVVLVKWNPKEIIPYMDKNEMVTFNRFNY